MLLGAFVGSIPASLVADKFSLRTAITGAAAVFFEGGIFQTAAVNKGMMLAGRFLAGLGIERLATLAPLYQSEIAHPSARGRIMATFQFFIGIGAFVAGWIACGCASGSSVGTALQWRRPLGFQMLPAVRLVVVTFLLPESPRWLMINGREVDALKTLARLHPQGNLDDPFVRGKFPEMKIKVAEEAANSC